MTERIKDFIKVGLMIGICMAGITFTYQLVKEGLIDALKYYDIHHSDIVYAQALLETGYFKSQRCLRDNNLFGLYNSKKGKYYKFNHWVESVEAYKNWIQKKYKPPEDYYKFLSRIRYASDPTYISKLKQRVKRNEKR